MAYDRADWHSGGDYPANLPPENGGTHIGIFLAWCIIHNLQGDFLNEECPDALRDVRERRTTGRDFLETWSDSKFVDADLNDEGNRFAEAYYTGLDENKLNTYLADYDRIFGKKYPSVYHAPNTWQTYDIVASVITARYEQWKRTGNVGSYEGPTAEQKPWWRFW